MQIGPRIRVGGTLGKFGQKVKIGAGKVAKTVAPVATLIPGVGPLAAAGLAAAGTALDTSKGAVNPLDIAKHAALSYGSGKMLSSAAGGAKGLDGIKNVGKTLIGQKVLTSGGGGGAGGVQQGAVQGRGTDVNGLISRVAGLFGAGDGGGAGGGGMSGMDKLLLGGAVAVGAADRAKAQQMKDRAADYATTSYDARAPMRTQGMTAALANLTPTPAPTYTPTSPYDRQRMGAPQLGARVPASGLAY